MTTRELMKKRLNWQIHGTEAIGSCPPIPYYRCSLGTDANGTEWICETHYRTQERKFLVRFDYETEEQSAFLKSEVVDAVNYWEAYRRVYHSKLVDYKNIQDVIAEFMTDQNIK